MVQACNKLAVGDGEFGSPGKDTLTVCINFLHRATWSLFMDT